MPHINNNTPADHLREIADALETVDLADLSTISLSLSIQPCPSDPDAVKIATVDALCVALTGSKAATEQLGSGSWHHNGRARREPVEVAVFAGVTDPKITATYAEVARLRAELAAERTRSATIAADRADPGRHVTVF